MDVPYSGFLDDTSSSQLTKSPAKTSTVAKEDIKWNEDAFFKRQGLPQSSESLFVTPAESPISASNEPINRKEILQKPKFDLNGSSFLSGKADSSLGILNVENFSGLSDISFQSTKFVKKRKKTKKLERKPRVASEENFSETFEERLSAATKDILENFERSIKENTDAGSNSSSDIEYDGTNIPELNMDCDILSLIRSDKTSFTEYDSSSKTDETSVSKSATFNKKESDLSEISSNSSEFPKSGLSDFSSRQSAENTRNSIFNNFQPSYESLYEQIVPEAKSKKEKAPKRITVCPFEDVSSFEIEPILLKSTETTAVSSVENTRCIQELSLDFCPEQISARSSSFKSSIKYDSSNSETPNISLQNKRSYNFPILPSPKEDLENEVLSGSENEVLSGSCLQIPETKFESKKDNSQNNEDFGNLSKYSSSQPAKNVSENINRLSNFPLEPKVLLENSSDLVSPDENWCNQLGLSESDFFSAEVANEMLKKDEKDQLLGTNKISGVSNWSPPSQLEVTAPSWFAELSSSQQLDSERHISIGTLFSARSEKLGSLSSDKERDRPYFGTEATTPPKPEEMVYFSAAKSSADNSPPFEDKNQKNIRASALSEFLDDISSTDPDTLASKIEEKYSSNNEEKSKKLSDIQTNISENSEHGKFPESSKISDRSAKSNIEESTTFIRSFDNNISRGTYIDTNVECKSTIEESDGSTLNYSVQSSSERGSIKTAKCDGFSSCSQPSSQYGPTQEFPRPASACSSTCSNHIPIEKTLSLQYGCMKYLSSGIEHNQNGIANSLQAGPCPHVCLHTMQPNLFLPFGACNPLQSVIQNALSGSVFLSGTSATCNGIQAPSELYFPEKIALGDSQEMILTVRNSANVAYYRILCVSAYLNGSPLPEGMSGLNFCNTVPCSVGDVTDVKLIIAPKYEGTFEVNLQVDAFVNSVGQTLNAAPSATVKTKIQYTVVRPCISILYKGKKYLNLGTVITGSSFVEYVTVINNSEVSVPLRISLSNDTAENQIYFGLKEMDRQRHPSSSALRFLSPTVLLYRLPASKNKNVAASLDIPVVFESINGTILSSITAAIETPTVFETLGFIKISATVGNARLILKDTDQNPLVLKASKGATCSHSLTVINDGSISVVYDITIDGDSDVLSVSPNSLNLQPKQCSTISVTFTPQTYCTVKGNLLAAAEPHGQVFVLSEIIGHVKENYPSKYQSNNHPEQSLRPTRDSVDSMNETCSQIECDKKYLAWGGRDTGSASLKTCTVRNAMDEPVQVKIFIKEKDKGFMLLDESGQHTVNYRLTINAKEAKDLSVFFNPKDVKSYSGQLYIKPVTQNEIKVFMIPLSGYGGTSNLKILNLDEDSHGDKVDYYMDIDATIGKEKVHKNILLHNVGLRPAFVKLFATHDNLVENVVSNQIFINPSEFVLLENEKKNVFISVNDLQRKQISKNEIISVLYGDEILRQRLKRISKSDSSNGRSYNENFTAHFDGEEKVPFDSTYRSSPKDETLFHTSLKKIKVHVYLNGQNTSFSRTSFGPLSEIQENFSNLTLNSTIASSSSVSSKLRRLTIESHSPPVKDSTAHNMNRLSLPIPYCDNLTSPLNTDDIFPSIINEMNNLKLNMWSVHPEELVIDADSKEKRILLKNYSNSDMRFKVECTIDVITVSPVSGTLSSKEEIGLRLTLISTNYNKLLDDYRGNIKIWCDGEEKIVSVLVMKDKKERSTLLPVLNDSLRSGFLSESDFLESTVVESTSRSLKIDNIFKFPKEIDLHPSKVGILSETVLVVGNPTKETVIWNICPRTMIFTEPSDDSVDTTRPAIEFKNTNGVIKPMATENIVIQFFPQSALCFQQFITLNLNSKNGSQLYNIKVQGKAEARLSFSYSDVVEKNRHNTTVKKKAKTELFIESDVCKFPDTRSGQKSRKEVIIKNISSQDFKLSINKPSLPFGVNFSTCTVKSKKYYRIPVYFKPLKPGKFESEIRFICDNGNELKSRLIGLCIA